MSNQTTNLGYSDRPQRDTFGWAWAAFALAAAVAVLVIAVAILLIALLWRPGCCCCCTGHQAVAANAAPSNTRLAAIPPDTSPITGVTRSGSYKSYVDEILPERGFQMRAEPQPELAYTGQPTSAYHATQDGHPFDLPPGVPAFIPPVSLGPHVGPPIFNTPTGGSVPVAEPIGWPLFAAAVAIALVVKIRGAA